MREPPSARSITEDLQMRATQERYQGSTGCMKVDHKIYIETWTADLPGPRLLLGIDMSSN